MCYRSMSNDKLREILNDLMLKYNEYVSDGVKLDMARGKPGNDQLDITEGLLTTISCKEDCKTDDGFDCRNYGILEGLTCARELFADVFDVDPEKLLLGGNSSLNMMYDIFSRAYNFGFCDSVRPWCKEERVRFLCPSPGYDRHFSICELFGIEMIVVPMNDDGPDMEVVRHYVEYDEEVKGIWCVPKYSNPTGIVYSDEVITQLAKLEPAAPDFRIFWDNAYAIHDFYDSIKIKDIFEECEKYGNPNMPIMFASTSKITFPGSGVALVTASTENINNFKKYMTVQTIGPDKINQLRHVKYFKNKDGVLEHMKRHAEILIPKFNVILEAFKKEFEGTGIATWTEPRGGYFISFNTIPGCAKTVYNLCKDAGLTLTNAGATFPYGKDPDDSNIRIAPSFPTCEQLKAAVERFVVCVKIASINKILSDRD